MRCGNCGRSGGIYYFRLGYMNGTGYQCQYCGFKWMEMGRPRHEIEFEKALKERFDSYRAYMLLGIVVWGIASVFHLVATYLFLTVPVSLKSVIPQVLIIVLGFGIVMGWTLCRALRFIGKYRNQKLIIRVPLLFAAIIGGLQGWVLYKTLFPNFLNSGLTLLIASGILLGLAVTPIIIVRGSKIRKQKGYGCRRAL